MAWAYHNGFFDTALVREVRKLPSLQADKVPPEHPPTDGHRNGGERMQVTFCHKYARSRRTGTVLNYLKVWLALWLDDGAVTALEYGLIAGLIVAVVTLGFTSLANSLSTKFVNIGHSL
jgi:Flp pilus assembly pilin Flp